jgi:5-methylcytosine-specific restriction enzyme A
MTTPRRPCLDCGIPSSGSRCPRHQRDHEQRRGTPAERGLGADHRRIREQVLREERVCWLCLEPARPGDPLTADHVVPRAQGGTNTRQNMRAAHRSCNSRRGARTTPGHPLARNRAVEEPRHTSTHESSAPGIW